MRHIFSRLGLLILAFSMTALTAARAEVPDSHAIEKKGLNGHYIIHVLQGNEWLEGGRLYFDKYVKEKKIDLHRFINGQTVRIRISQNGGNAAHIDTVLLGNLPPESVDGDKNFILKKVSRKDFDVIDAHKKTLEFCFPGKGEDGLLSLTARIEGRIFDIPFQFPIANLYKKINEEAKFYTYPLNSKTGGITIDGILGEVIGNEPFFKEYCKAGSGHPSGFTYGWVKNDEENLYVAIDFTGDNTVDGDKDYSKLYVKTDRGIKEFKVSGPETRWGRPGFTYTDKVVYQHKIYEFRIPLQELGIISPSTGKKVMLAFATYGTAGPGSYLDVLIETIDQATALHLTTSEGTEPGKYAPGSKAKLWAAIQTADAVAVDPDATDDEFMNATNALVAAISEYQATFVYWFKVVPLKWKLREHRSTGAFDINRYGQIIGHASTGEYGKLGNFFIMSPVGGKWLVDDNNDSVNDLFVSLGPHFHASAINDSAEIAGYMPVPGSGTLNHAVVWSGGIYDVGTLVEDNPKTPKNEKDTGSSSANGINNSGQVVGTSNFRTDALFFLKRAFVDKESLGTLRGDEPYESYQSWATDINDSGTAVGYSDPPTDSIYLRTGFVWQHGEMQALEPLAGNLRSEALAINNAGKVVGYSYFPDEARACLWDDSTAQNLGTLGGSESKASDINNDGHVVGYSLNEDGERVGFLWLPEPAYHLNAGMHSIEEISGNEARLEHAVAINDDGLIIGSAVTPGSCSYAAVLVPWGYDPPDNVPEIPEDFSISGKYPMSGEDRDPVNTLSGELLFHETIDLDAGGPMPLRFSRQYASGLNRLGTGGALGLGWRHNFEWLLDVQDDTAAVVDHRGQSVTFKRSGESWTLDRTSQALYQLLENDSVYLFVDLKGTRVYTFNSSGKLTKIEDNSNNALTLSYSNGLLAQVEDGLGRMLTFTYNVDNHLNKVTDGIRTIRFDYTGHVLTQYTDARGHETAFCYNDEGLMTSWRLPERNTPYTQTYDQEGRVVTQTDAFGNQHTFEYSGHNTNITDPYNNTRLHTHSNSGELIKDQSQDSLSISIGYDSDGRRHSITDRLGDVTSVSYHEPSGRISSITHADGAITTYSYTLRSVGGIDFYDLTDITYPDGSAESFVYDSAGNRTSRTDPAGNVWGFTYNNRGQLLTATNPVGGITTFTYNTDGTLASYTDPSGNKMTFSYDSLRRLSAVTHADGATQSFSYDNNDNLLTLKDERNSVTTFAHNANNHLTGITDPLGNTHTFTLDDMERISSVTDPNENTTTRTYNELERLKTYTDQSGNATTFGYDLQGRLTSMTDAAGKVFSWTYDVEGIPTSSTNPLANTWTYTSDQRGRFRQLTSPLGNTVTLTYDSMGRTTEITNPLGGTTTFTYDALGLLSNITLPGSTITASYKRNALGLITKITDPRNYDWQRVYDEQGRLTARKDPLGNQHDYVYDNRNRISRVTLPGNLGTLDTGYDASGNITRLFYSDGTDLNFAYDERNRLVSANGVSLSYDANSRIIESNDLVMTRDESGRIKTLTLAPGKVVSYSYNNRNLLSQVSDWLGDITTFAYDDAGRLTTMNRPNGVTTTYSYDNDDRITGISEGDISTISLTLDAKGQITSATRNIPLAAEIISNKTKTLTYDAACQVASFSYDELGRLTDDGVRTYGWDLASRLTSYTEANNTISFTYDALGLRLSRTEGGITRDYIWNYAVTLPCVNVEQENGGDLRYYITTPEGNLLYIIEASGNTRRDYHYDEMGNTIFLTDSSGTVIESYAYTPYGEIISERGNLDNPFTFAGMRGVMRENKRGLYYMRARYYDSGSARFISRDPIGSDDPIHTNPYQYAMGNPLEYGDPNGLDEEAIRKLPNKYTQEKARKALRVAQKIRKEFESPNRLNKAEKGIYNVRRFYFGDPFEKVRNYSERLMPMEVYKPDRTQDRKAWKYVKKIAKFAEEHGWGNCSELGMVLAVRLHKMGMNNIEIFARESPRGGRYSHVFVVVDRNPTSNPNDPNEWGDGAFIVDAWDEDGRIILPSQALSEGGLAGEGRIARRMGIPNW